MDSKPLDEINTLLVDFAGKINAFTVAKNKKRRNVFDVFGLMLYKQALCH